MISYTVQSFIAKSFILYIFTSSHNNLFFLLNLFKINNLLAGNICGRSLMNYSDLASFLSADCALVGLLILDSSCYECFLLGL